MKLKVALLQISPKEFEKHWNLTRGVEVCREAKAKGADIVLFPEMWSIGYPSDPYERETTKWLESAIDDEDEFLKTFKNLSMELEIHIGITYLRKNHPKPLNSVSLINPSGEVVLTYSKVFICEWEEDHDVGADLGCMAGNDFPVCTLDINGEKINVGFMICADREFPEAAESLMKNGAEVILVPNSSTFDFPRKIQLQTRAWDSMSAIFMTNYPKPKNNGHSIAISPVVFDEEGNALNTINFEADESEGLFIAEIDTEIIHRFRDQESWRMNYLRRD